ncbi:hypothetical protein [Catellatospora sp. NPDC049609]|uniref:hypothetical protein n=1 Tax=Catellatospora sp. NPDC049609 TaxID=3155505 RepID=UPI00341847F6
MRDDEILAAIAARVADRDYRDEVFVRRGTLTETGVWLVDAADDGTRQVEPRGSRAHLAALAAGAVDPLPELAPARVEAVEEAERVLGHALPPLLRRIYLEVANGGFGPDVLGVAGGHEDDLERTAVDIRRDRDDPPGLWAVCSWGCAIASYVDCADPGYRMWGFDPTTGRGMDAFFPEDLTLAQWFERWLDGTLNQPWLIQDGDVWRGATDAEHAAAHAEMLAWAVNEGWIASAP